MKHKFLGIAATAAVSAAILSGCAQTPDGTPEDTRVFASETSVQIPAGISEIGSETAGEITAETEAAAADKSTEPEYVKVSPNNEFIDFDFIENYQGTTDIGGLADKAVEHLKTTDFYAESVEHIDEFTDGEFAEYIKDGKIIPKFNTAYPNDYDGDGKTETFIVADMPVKQGNQRLIRSFFIFADSSENMTLLSNASNLYGTQLLNYGEFKQITFGGSGTCGADDHTELYSVENGEAKELFNIRGNFYKSNCFLSAFSWQSSGAFMYYDTAAGEYRAIDGKSISIERIKEMDSTNALSEFYEWYDENGFLFAELIGGRYYVFVYGVMDSGTAYLYENGEFIQTEECSPVRNNHFDRIIPKVVDIDINKAIAEMKKPVEPFVKVSPDNEFIDYEMIENYQGTDDIGELADKAIEFVKGTEQYADSVKNIDKFSYKAIKEIHTDEKYAKEDADKVAPYINGGNVEPLVSAAYTADYDGDGKTETFIVVDIPYIVWSYPDVWSFLLFIDGSENADPVLLDFYEGYSASMLNYGKNKQLVFSGWDGMHSYASIYGVKDGKPVTLYDHCPGGYFRKTDCFLSVFGLQGWSDFMYFDTTVREYRIIKGVEISRDEMAELDVSGTLCSHCNAESLDDLPDYAEFHFIKPNYYLIDWGFPGSDLFTYESGAFAYDEDSNIPSSVNGSNLDIIAEFDIDKAVAEMKPPAEPYVTISPDNEFIDYEFIENYPGTTDIGSLADKAAEFLKTTEDYADSMEHIAEFTDKEGSDHFSDYIKGGKIIPKFNTAYPNDYDGDGTSETFIIVDMPIVQGHQSLIRSFFIFADSSENMTLLSNASNLYGTQLLNYGNFKQVTFGGFGTCGADDHTELYGVADGNVTLLYSMRGELHKSSCFLSSFGVQGWGQFMYYDTVAGEYRAITGIDVPIEKIKEMDSTNELSEFYEWLEEHESLRVQLVGDRYYVVYRGAMDIGTAYLYENGKFIQTEECKYVRDSHYTNSSVVVNIDINKAIAEMKSP